MEEKQKTVKKNNGAIVLVSAIVVALGVGFFGGMQYQKSKKVTNFGNNLPSSQQGTTARNGSNTKNGGPGGSQPVSGEITNIDDTGITIKTPNGGSKIIVFSSSTVFNKNTQGAKTDLKTGDNVMIIGTTDTSGTVTAQTVSMGLSGLQFQGGAEQPPSEN